MSKKKSIPLRNYFEEESLAQERKKLFAKSPEYIGAADMVRQDGDFRSLERLGNAKVLVRSSGKIRLLENICSHRQSILVKGSGHTDRLVCPVHQWKYGLNGACEHTPMMKCEMAKHNLKEFPLYDWHGLLFTGPQNTDKVISQLSLVKDLELANLRYSQTVSETVEMNWKHMIDAFAEDYHVPFIHPGFASTIITDSLTRYNFKNFTAQSFLMRDRAYLESCKSTPAYRRWIDLILRAYPKQLPKYGGVLILYYPNILIEWYPFSLIVTTVHPVSAQQTICHLDFFHNEEALRKFPELGAIAEETFLETAKEDSILCESITAGRKALYEQGREMDGPIQRHLEDGIEIFRAYYLAAMKKKS